MRAPSWTLQEALRWLTGSVNGVQLDQALPLLIALLLFGGLLLSRHRDLETLRMGDDLAAGLGVRLAVTRVMMPAALVGALLVLLGDYAGQFLLPARYPVGIVTGVLGAPYLLYLILRDNKTRGSL